MVNSTQALDATFFEQLEELGGSEPIRRGGAFERSGRQRFNTQRRYARGKSGWSAGGAHQRSGKKRHA
ncbi:MAG: hypothetical protein KDA42_09975 [Planctomycetales bacterium]|nr:hypothetical protein [Planctomycetales bacterium]